MIFDAKLNFVQKKIHPELNQHVLSLACAQLHAHVCVPEPLRMTTIAERLLLIRGNIKQGEFAKTLEVNPNTLRSYENGRTSPNQDFLERICVQFSVSPEWLLLGKGPIRAENGREDGTTKNEKVVFVEEGSCSRCIHLQQRLDTASDKLVETLQANVALITELGEQKLENVKLAQQLETARQMCREYGSAAKNAEAPDPLFDERQNILSSEPRLSR